MSSGPGTTFTAGPPPASPAATGSGRQPLRPAASGLSVCPELVEREGAANCLLEQVELLLAGQSGSSFLIGAAGLGKTTLLDWLEGLASRCGLSLSRAVASPMERALPFGFADQALRGLGADAGLAASRSPAAGNERLARFTRTLLFLEKASSEKPLVLLLDDLHWADTDSIDLVGFICRRLAGLPVLVVGTMRPEPAGGVTLAADLAGTRHAKLVNLDPLSRTGSDTLLESLLGRRPDSTTSERLWQVCAGSPLLLHVATALQESGAAGAPAAGAPAAGAPAAGAPAAGAPAAGAPAAGAPAAGAPAAGGPAAGGPAAGGPATGLPATGGHLASLVLERFVDIGEPARGYVEAAAVLGIRFRPRDAARLAGLDGYALARAHGQLLRSRLLEDLGPGWARFAHPLFAQAVLDALPGPRRDRLHEEAFHMLVDNGGPDALAAQHAVAAGLAGDPLAIEVVWRTGRDALAQGALASAEAHLANAVMLAGDQAPDGLLIDHLRALVGRAQPDKARRACAALLDRPDLPAPVRAEAVRLLARAAAIDARPREVEHHFEAAVAVLGPEDRDQAAQILADGILTGLVSSPLCWVAKLCEQAIEITPHASSLHAHLDLLGCYIALLGGDPSGVGTILAAAARPELHHDGTDQSWTWAEAVHIVNALKALEAFDEASRLFDREFQRAVDAGAPWLMHALSIAYADALHRLGRVQDALALVRRTTELAEHAMRPWNDLAMAVLLVELGRNQEAEGHLAFLREYVAEAPEDCNAPVRLWLGLLESRELLGRGEAEAASERMAAVEATAALTGFREPCIVPWAGVAVEAHVAAGRLDAAERVVTGLEALAAPLPCRWPAATALLGRARIAAAATAGEGAALGGRRALPPGDADRLFDQALAAFEPLPLPIARAEALLAYGRHLRRGGRAVQARELLRTALSLAEGASSERLARCVRAELSAAGGRRRSHKDDPEALTAQEERVCNLASEGLTNVQIAAALYISPKTVEHHLAKVFVKLGLSSRRELIRARLVRQG